MLYGGQCWPVGRSVHPPLSPDLNISTTNRRIVMIFFTGVHAPRDESYWFWWYLTSSNATMRLTFVIHLVQYFTFITKYLPNVSTLTFANPLLTPWLLFVSGRPCLNPCEHKIRLPGWLGYVLSFCKNCITSLTNVIIVSFSTVSVSSGPSITGLAAAELWIQLWIQHSRVWNIALTFSFSGSGET